MGHSIFTAMSSTFADLLMQYRERAGFSISELSEEVGATRKSISEWERGKRVPRDRARLHDLAEKLGLSSQEERDFYAAARGSKPSGLVDNYYYERGEIFSAAL